MKQTIRAFLFLGSVWLLVAAIRLALWLRPFPTVRRLARRWGQSAPLHDPVTARTPRDIARAVRRTIRFVPRPSCLTQALAAHVLLCRAGYEPRIRIGLAHDRCGVLRAHAWVENGGDVVIGGGELDRFVPLPAMESL